MLNLRSLVRLSFVSFFGLTSLLIFVLISSSPVQEILVVHSQIHSVPHEFLVNGDADPDHTLSLTIHLASNNMSGLERELYAVSDPISPRYGQHLNKTEVDSFVRPSEEASATLDQWLSDQGIKPQSKSSGGSTVKIQVSVKKANAMLNTTFQSFTHTPSNRTVVRATAYSLPARLSNHTEGIYPITNLPKLPIVSSVGKPTTPSNATFRRDVDAGCEDSVTPACVQRLYNIPDNTTQGAIGEVGILSFNGANVKGVEVAEYLRFGRPDFLLSGVQVNIMSVAGGDESQTNFSTTFEGNVDTQLVLGIRPQIPVTVYSHSGDGELLDLLDLLNFLLNQNTHVKVLNFNYVFQESLEGDDVKLESAVCKAIMQLGAQGVSFIANSGSGGAADIPQLLCSDSSGLSPSFPGSCPFVTSVGATVLSSGAEEVGSTLSGSGFSNIFARPPYQSAAVQGYLNQIGSLNKGVFNASGRGFPDIAAIAENVPFIFNGEFDFVPAVSNAPIVAAIIADLNAQRQNQGKSSLGFLNPLLYSNPHAFQDITQGENFGCADDGFPAKLGWDALTGLGSPNYTALQQII